MKAKATAFLDRHGMNPQRINPAELSSVMLEHMYAGLAGDPIDMPMIPTHLSCDGEIPEGKMAVVIDAGGTNYRCGLAEFTPDGCKVRDLKVCRMPGTGTPATWDELVSFVDDSIEPLLAETDYIGFCFSYNADITPDMDGVVQRIDKEVVITGCEGKHIGASLIAELERRGIYGKKVVILNDTVAALLGGMAAIKKENYSGFAGMICGTGVNTCCAISGDKITKLPAELQKDMLINLESGLFNGIPLGDVDIKVDAESNNPGEKIMEKMCSGAYIGIVCRGAMNAAVADGDLPASVLDRIAKIERFDGSVVDEWATGKDSNGVFDSKDDLEFAMYICRAIFERSARCMCTNIISLMLLTESGITADKPMCVCAEGSLIGRSTYFKQFLDMLMDEYALNRMGLHAEIVLGKETTLPGSAAAVLLNA